MGFRVESFLRRETSPRPRLVLVLVAVTVCVVAMHYDDVLGYSSAAFVSGIVWAIAMALVLGDVPGIRQPAMRLFASLLLTTFFGALLGMFVQLVVLADTWNRPTVYDLGGLVDTSESFTWVASGIVLGGVPALAVAVFLVAAGRALRRFGGHDASERFGVRYVGAAGIVAASASFLVDRLEALPLFAVAITAWGAVLVLVFVDGARIAFLRAVFRGEEHGFEIMPAAHFATGRDLAPLVAQAGAEAVLVKVARSASYRGAAATPMAYLAETEEATIAPLARRRRHAAFVLAAIVLLCLLATSRHLFGVYASNGSPSKHVVGALFL